MKENTRKLLFILNLIKTDTSVGLREDQLKWFFPQITASGQRSLLYLLIEKGWIIKRKGPTDTRLQITESGIKVLEYEMPIAALLCESPSFQWRVCMFMSSSRRDPEFRKLRSYLSQKRVYFIARGVYAYPTWMESSIDELLVKQYANNVLAFLVDPRDSHRIESIEAVYREWSDLYASYSGVSSKTESLLTVFNTKKELISRDKSEILSVVNEFYQAVQDEVGMGWITWAEAPVRRAVVNRMCKLIHIL